MKLLLKRGFSLIHNLRVAISSGAMNNSEKVKIVDSVDYSHVLGLVTKRDKMNKDKDNKISTIIDVRSKSEIESSGMIPNSHNIPSISTRYNHYYY